MTVFRWSQAWGLRKADRAVALTLDEVVTAITRCLLLSARSTDQLAAQLKNVEIAVIQDALRQMRDDGKIACTGERWWLRGAALADLHKAQEREQRQSDCHCSDFMSGGIPCPIGKCPNAPRIQSR